jgi:hypothetical protein
MFDPARAHVSRRRRHHRCIRRAETPRSTGRPQPRRTGEPVLSSGGFDVTNPADGTRYEVRPHRLRILSNGHVDSSEPVLQYASAS